MYLKSLFFVLVAGLAWVAQGALPPAVEAAINAVLLPAAESAEVSALFEDVRTGERLYTLASKVRRVPASTQKLLTTLVALRAWGEAATYTTTLSETKEKDTLILTFTGDPSLTTAHIEALFTQLLVDRPWKTLKIIDTFPQIEAACPSWMFEDLPSNYASPLGGAIIGSNRVNVTAFPGIAVSDNAQAHFSTPYAYENRVLTGESGTKIDLQMSWENNHLLLTGNLPYDAPPITEDFSAPSVKIHAETVLNDILKKQELAHLIVSYERGPSLPLDLHPLATHTSAPLSTTIIPALQDSDNVYFDALFLKLGLEEAPTASNWEAVASAFKIRAQRLLPEMNLDNWQVADGSGLSVKNWVNAEDMLALFKLGESNPAFMAAVPVAGGPGHLKGRFPAFKGKVQAKNGGLSGTGTLAGLFTLPNDAIWRFVLFVNQGEPARERKLLLQEAVFQAITTAVEEEPLFKVTPSSSANEPQSIK